MLSDIRKQNMYCVTSGENSATITILGKMASAKRLLFEMV